ncbi:hypothetical protein [Nostoc sp. CHAB 5715]|uniref:hypothetical protein n=1 Tax=Nostoc sp. CHAB 5715 TaxID=2780400 RepID=UPI001E54802D|nr:hypothetical protein [Nostoc sp. CHAB 5715]MCC5625257.1 hypothetical protein [Nostoc sp. CHAB 5715]
MGYSPCPLVPSLPTPHSPLPTRHSSITINITLLKYHSLARLVKGGNSCFDNDVNWMSAATPK